METTNMEFKEVLFFYGQGLTAEALDAGRLFEEPLKEI